MVPARRGSGGGDSGNPRRPATPETGSRGRSAAFGRELRERSPRPAPVGVPTSSVLASLGARRASLDPPSHDLHARVDSSVKPSGTPFGPIGRGGRSTPLQHPPR